MKERIQTYSCPGIGNREEKKGLAVRKVMLNEVEDFYILAEAGLNWLAESYPPPPMF